MNKPSVTLLATLLATSASLHAAEMTVSIDGFADPTTFMITDSSDLSLRVAELVPTAGANNSTHVLIEGLAPLEDGTSYFASPYSGIDVASGETQDSGILYLEMPAGSELPAGTVASPIVGVVQRAGSWSDFSLSFPSTTIGGASGEGAYETGTLTLTLTRGSDTFTGSTSYTVVDEDTIELDPFTVTAPGPTSVDLSGVTMLRDGSRFYGTATNLSAGAAYDSLLYSVQFTSIPDVDMDGIPDISDAEIDASGTLDPGVWNLTTAWYIYGHTAEWGYSPFLGHVLVRFPWLYQPEFGWLYYHSAVGDGSRHWLWSPETGIGWIYVNQGHGGYFLYDSGSGWQWNNFLEPNPS